MSNVKCFYIRNEWKKRDITIVSDLFSDKDGKSYIKFGWAFRSNHEKQFIKREGRKLAMERMNSNDVNYSAWFEVSEVKFTSIIADIIRIIMNKETTPQKYIPDLVDDLWYFENMPSPNLNNEEKWRIFNNHNKFKFVG
jgi:hypothetical protein